MATPELSVFGLGSSVDIITGTLALTGMVGFTVVFEMGAHRLEHKLTGTPYMGMLAKIYKELMIMGVISLGVFLTLELGGVGDSIEFYAFEFAHIVIFFTTLIFVMQACLMMVISAKLKNRYERSTNITVDHLLSIYSLHRKSWVFHARWLPISDLREVMEFKIVHAFFRTTFALPTNFDFALYMREASDSHILSLVDVDPSTWMILAGACFLNLARVKVWKALNLTPMDDHSDDAYPGGDDHATDDDHAADDDHRRWLAVAAGTDTNSGSDGELMFIVSGWILLGIAIGNYVMSRWIEVRLLRRAGCNSTHDYQARLCVIEKHFIAAKALEEKNRRKGSKGNHLERLKLQVDKAKVGGRGRHGQRQGSKSDGGKNLQRRLTQTLHQAKRHAKAATSNFGSSDFKRGVGGTSPLGPALRFKGTRVKVLPGGEDAIADEGMKTIDLLSGGLLSPGSTISDVASENRQPQQGVTGGAHGRVTESNLRNGRSPRSPPQGIMGSPALDGSNSSASSCAGREGEETRAKGAASRERALQPLRRGGGGASRSATSATPVFEPHQGAVSDSEGGIHVARYGGGGEDWELEDGVVEDFKVHQDADRDGLEDRFVMDVPTLLPSARGPAVQPYLAKVNKPEPRAKIAEEEDSDDNNDDESTFRYMERGDSRSFSQHSIGRRASINIKHGARRLSVSARRLTTRLAADVTKAAYKISGVPGAHAVPRLNLYNDISYIYPLSSPKLFHKTLDVLLLLSCTYLALWAVNFMTVANEKPYSFLRHAAMLLPAAGVFLFNALSVKTSSLLLAISAMDPEIIGKVLDGQIDQEKLVVQFRDRLVSRLDELGLGKSGLATAFEEVDVAGRGELTIKELSTVFFKLNFHASKAKYRKLFNAMDKNRKGVVTYNQLFELVYNLEAEAQEAVALKMKGKLHAIQ